MRFVYLNNKLRMRIFACTEYFIIANNEFTCILNSVSLVAIVTESLGYSVIYNAQNMKFNKTLHIFFTSKGSKHSLI